SRFFAIAIVVAGSLSGTASAGVLVIINRALHEPDEPLLFLFGGFVALVAGKIVTVAGSQLLLARFAQGTILQLSIDLSAQIVRSPLRTVERHGEGRLLVTLTDDVSAVTWAAQRLPQLVMNGAVVAACSLYL